MKFPFAAIALLTIAGCGGGSGDSYVPAKKPPIPPASVTAGQEASLFPFKVGNSWTYKAATTIQIQNRQTSREAEVTFKVAKVEDVAGGKRATLDLISNGKTVDRQVWISTSKGIFQVSIGTTKQRVFSSPIPAIQFPVAPDKKFSWKGSDGKASMTYNFTIIGPQEVDTEEKRMSGIAVEAKGTSTAGKVTEKTERTMWFAPGVGIVRIRESTLSNVGLSEMLLSLKSHTVK
jgi:hypothetical protein